MSMSAKSGLIIWLEHNGTFKMKHADLSESEYRELEQAYCGGGEAVGCT
jgi:hypothetical protein